MIKNNVLLKTIYFGLSYLTLFITYNLAQGYLTTIYEGQGFVFLATIYFPYAFLSLVSAFIGKKIGLKCVLLLGSVTYVIWTLVVTTSIYWLIICLSVINGLGAGLLWVHQGIYITHLINMDPCSNRDGTISGLFFGLYNFNGIISNIITMILVKYYDLILILRVMSGFTVLTWSLFWFIPLPDWFGWKIKWNFPNLIPYDDYFSCSSENESDVSENAVNAENAENESQNDDEITVEIRLSNENSLRNHSRRLGNVWLPERKKEETERTTKMCLPKFPFLIPIMILIALLNILAYGTNPALAGKSIPPGIYDSSFIIAGFFLFYSTSSAIFSISWGYLYDWLGWIFLIIVIQLLLLGELIFIAINISLANSSINVYYGWWIVGFIAGIVDTGYNVLLNASITSCYKKDVTPYIFSWYRFVYCLSCSLFSLMNYGVAPLYIIYLIIGWSLLTTLCVTIFNQN